MDFILKEHKYCRQLPLHQFEQLQEMNYGNLEGQYYNPNHPETVWSELNTSLELWKNGFVDHRIPGGESPVDVEKRAVSIIKQILKKEDLKTILLMSHGRLLRVVLCSLLEKGLQNMYQLEQYNTAINILDFDEDTGKFQSISLNSTQHLQ